MITCKDALKAAVLIGWISFFLVLIFLLAPYQMNQMDFTNIPLGLWILLLSIVISQVATISLFFFVPWAKNIYLYAMLIVLLWPASNELTQSNAAVDQFDTYHTLTSGFILAILLITSCYEEGIKDRGKHKYHVFYHPTIGYKTVREGFSVPAFFFTGLWALFNKMWLHAVGATIGLGVANIIVTLLLKDEALTLPLEASLIVMLAFGLLGSSWKKRELLDRGFSHIKTLQTSSADKAIAITEELKQHSNSSSKGNKQ